MEGGVGTFRALVLTTTREASLSIVAAGEVEALEEIFGIT